MRKSMTSKLLAENKWLKKQVSELKKDIHTLITKPDGYEALEIKAGRQMSQQAIDGIMAGSYGKGIKLKPLDKETLDQFVDNWKKVPVKLMQFTSSKATETQVGGNHYASMKIQPTVFIHENNIPFLEGNVIKYVVRHRHKNGKQDIEKAIHYLQLLLQLEYDNPEPRP